MIEVQDQDLQFASLWPLKFTPLPEQYDAELLNRVCSRLDWEDLLDRWLYWTEIAEVARRNGIISRKQAEEFVRIIRFPFYMLPYREPLVVGCYRIEQDQRARDKGWFRVTVVPPTSARSPKEDPWDQFKTASGSYFIGLGNGAPDWYQPSDEDIKDLGF